ncbi:hypothetical protein BH10ACT3_BH10ACT3_15030 [soil metagenome]
MVCELLPDQAEAHGLAALLLHSAARSAARRDPEGRFVPLGEQDITLWSRDSIEAAEAHLTTALSLRSLGPYQLMGAIQSVHNRRAATGSTDWLAIRQLYDGLVVLEPSVGVQVARAAAVLEADGANAALTCLDGLDERRTSTYQPYWVVRGEALGREGRPSAAAARRALDLTTDPSVARHLQQRFDLTTPSDGGHAPDDRSS